MIKMVVKVCTHCNKLIDDCDYQQGMRAFNLDSYADIWTEEIEVPRWTLSTGSEKS